MDATLFLRTGKLSGVTSGGPSQESEAIRKPPQQLRSAGRGGTGRPLAELQTPRLRFLRLKLMVMRSYWKILECEWV